MIGTLDSVDTSLERVELIIQEMRMTRPEGFMGAKRGRFEGREGWRGFSKP